MNSTKVYFVIGVSGAGKTTIGKMLANELKVPFFDGDDYHPKTNIAKMVSGKPLNDDDRYEWLHTLNLLAIENKKDGCVIACSGLKESYRQILRRQLREESIFVFLDGAFDIIKERIDQRPNHFMSSDLLRSQFDTLETPMDAIKIEVTRSAQEIVETIKSKVIEKNKMKKAEFGLYGLGVMGKSLSRNLARNGFTLALFNRHVSGKEENVARDFIDQYEELSASLAFDEVSSFVASLETPRKIMLMVNAGNTVDSVIESLIPHLDDGDIIIDGGNSNYHKTNERAEYLKQKNKNFVGTGVSGGEEGALKGPSIMPGCSVEAYAAVGPYLEAIAAKDADHLPCCTHIGTEGSGHFVKMIHNGIEYVEMQLLAEIYTMLRSMGNNPNQIADILESWKAKANSYLLEITIDILRKKEAEGWLLDKIMDKAGNKGTGNWTAITTAQLGVPSTMIPTALFARYTSFYKEERVAASKHFDPIESIKLDVSLEEILEAYQFARLVNHYQGFKLIKEASLRYEWHLNLSELSRIWTNGCIIRSALMVELVDIFKETDNLLEHKEFVSRLIQLRPSVKKVAAECIINEIAIPSMSEAINFLNGFVVADGSANLIQAQRDYFGAHTYQRKDDESQKFYHTEWKNE